MAEYEVEKMQPGEQPAVIGALARAFYDDPLFGFFLPNHVRQSKALLAFMGATVRDCAPFAGAHRRDLSAAQRAEWQRWYQDGWSAFQATKPASAISSLALSRVVESAAGV